MENFSFDMEHCCLGCGELFSFVESLLQQQKTYTYDLLEP